MARPFAGFAQTALLGNSAHTIYHGLPLAGEKNTSNGATLLLPYSFGASIRVLGQPQSNDNLSVMFSPDTTLQNRYRILRVLSHKGGMGLVYLAHALHLNCQVVLKQIRAPKDQTEIPEEWLSAFQREASLLAKLSHPALPSVLDFFVEDDGHFLVMKYIEGDDLDELLHKRQATIQQPFAWSQAAVWAGRVLDALEYLHSQQPPVIHRDIKPANLKLTERGDLFLLDFGLAKASAHKGSASSVWGYTKAYASYEQLSGLGTDARSDLFSLAATLYHLLTGTPPLNSGVRASALVDGQTDPLQPPDELNPQIPLNVSQALLRALALRAEDRPATARAFHQALFPPATPSQAARTPAPHAAEASVIIPLRPRADANPSVPQPTASRTIPAAHYAWALVIVLEAGRGTMQMLQQHLAVSLEQAHLLLERMRQEGILDATDYSVQLDPETRARALAAAKAVLAAHSLRRAAATNSPSSHRVDNPSSALRQPPTRARKIKIDLPAPKAPATANQTSALMPQLHKAGAWLGTKLRQGARWLGAVMWQVVVWLSKAVRQWASKKWQAFRSLLVHPRPPVHRKAKALALLALGFIPLFVLLITSEPNAVNVGLPGYGEQPEKRVGSLGTSLGAWLHNTIGFIAYVPPLFALWRAWVAWQPRKTGSSILPLLGCSFGWLAFTCLLAIADFQGPPASQRTNSYSRLIGGWWVNACGDWGAPLIFAFVLLISLFVTHQEHFDKATDLATTTFVRVANLCWHLFTRWLANAFARLEAKVLPPQQPASHADGLPNMTNEEDWSVFEMDETIKR